METPAPTTEKTFVTDYMLVVNGVFGRNRSAKTTSVKVVRTAKGVEPEMTVDEMVKKGLEALKMKRGTYALVARPVEVKGIFESFLLFSETVLTKGSV